MAKKDEKQPRNLSELPVKQGLIEVSRVNDAGRQRGDYGNIEELKLSIKQKGLIHPIAVMKYKETLDDRWDYFLLAGGRRLKAFKGLELEKIPARIYPDGLNAFEIKSIELEENIRRKDMSDAERLKAIKQIHDLWVSMYGTKDSTAKDAGGHSLRDTAKRLGVSVGTASEHVEMGEWLENVPELAKLGSKTEIKKAIKKAKKQVSQKKKIERFENEVGNKEETELRQIYSKSYIIGDFFEKVKVVPKNTIDLVDLDIDYPVDIDEESPQHQDIQMDKKFGKYKGVPKTEFEARMKESLRESYRVLRDGGWCIIWFGWEYFAQIQKWGQDIGFKTSWYTGKWYKGGGYGHTRNPYTYLNHTIEPFFYFRKGVANINIPRADVFEYSPTPPSVKDHPYEKPIPLMYDILNTFIDPGSRVLVPYVGSGNTLIAGFKLKCHAIGFDSSDGYKDSYIVKVQELVL